MEEGAREQRRPIGGTPRQTRDTYDEGRRRAIEQPDEASYH